MHTVHFLSEPLGNKPQTLVTGEIGYPFRLRERAVDEPIHHKKRTGQTRCLVCHTRGPFIWQSSIDKHLAHPARCT